MRRESAVGSCARLRLVASCRLQRRWRLRLAEAPWLPENGVRRVAWRGDGFQGGGSAVYAGNTTFLFARALAGATGLEPATSGVTVRTAAFSLFPPVDRRWFCRLTGALS